MTVGLIGVGLLGSAMAERLVGAGFRVAGFDSDSTRLVALAALGGSPAASAAEAVRQGDVVLLSLPDSTIGAAVLDSLQAELAGPGKLVIDTTTGSPGEMESFGRRGFRYVDATVAGSSQQVRRAEAAVMAGGAHEDVAVARPLFSTFARSVFHVGPCGAGARMKLVVNLALGLNRAVLAEALTFAQSCGIDGALALEVLRASPAYSRVMDTKGERMLARGWSPPEARLSQHHKDVGLILTEGVRHGALLPLSTLHDSLLARAEQAGLGALDNSSILEVFLKHEEPPSP